MKATKFVIAVLLLLFVASSFSSCSGGYVCQAQKVGNHRTR